MEVEIKTIETENETRYSVNGSDTLITEEELNTQYFFCAVCEKWHPIEDKFNILDNDEDMPFCNNCRENGNVHFCNRCETWTLGDVYRVGEDDYYLCKTCLEDEIDGGTIAQCERCGDYYHVYSDNIHWFEDAEEWYCDYCMLHIEYYCCDDCGGYFRYEDSGEWVDRDWYCNACAPRCNRRGPIGHYHDMKGNREIEFHGGDRTTELHMGAEIELAGGHNVNDIAQWVVDTFNDGENVGFMNPEEDCSVAVEIISEPATVSYWESLRPKLDKFFEYIHREGHNTDYGNGAGGHIHCDREWFEAQPGFTNWGDVIMKLEYILKRYYYELLAFARRPYMGYGESHHYYMRPKNSVRAIRDAVNGDGTRVYEIRERYYALNITNENTIEFRIFGCYDSTTRLMAYLKFAERLCTLSVTKTIDDIYRMTFEDIIGDDTDIRAVWTAEKSRFFDFVGLNWYNIAGYDKILYVDEYPELNMDKSIDILAIKEAM